MDKRSTSGTPFWPVFPLHFFIPSVDPHFGRRVLRNTAMFYVALLSALATRPVLFSPGSSLVFCHWVVNYSRAYSHNPYASGDRCHLDFLPQNGIYESCSLILGYKWSRLFYVAHINTNPKPTVGVRNASRRLPLGSSTSRVLSNSFSALIWTLVIMFT